MFRADINSLVTIHQLAIISETRRARDMSRRVTVQRIASGRGAVAQSTHASESESESDKARVHGGLYPIMTFGYSEQSIRSKQINIVRFDCEIL